MGAIDDEDAERGRRRRRAIDRKWRRQRRGAAARGTRARCNSRFGILRRAESGDRWIDVVLRRSGRPERRAPDVGGELGGAGSSAKRRSTS